MTVNEYLSFQDQLVGNKTARYDSLLGDVNPFFKNLFSQIIYFLEESTASELFIKVPTRELGTKRKDQSGNFTLLQGAVVDALYLATAKELQIKLKAPNLEPEYVNKKKFYVIDDCPWTNGISVWQLVESKNASAQNGVRPKMVFPTNQSLRTSECIKFYNENKSKFKAIRDFNTQSNGNTLKKIQRLIAKALKYCELETKEQYSSALFVGFNDNAEQTDRLYNSENMFSPVTFCNNYDTASDNYDIIAFVGDNKYNNLLNVMNRHVGLGETRKVIYIGSEFEGYEPSEQRAVYEFSFYEMYHYFAKEYPKITTQIVEFPWLKNKAEEIHNYVDGIEGIDGLAKKRIVGRILRHNLCMDIRTEAPDDIDQFSDFLYEVVALEEEQEDNLIGMYKETYWSEISPKKKYFDALKKRINNDKLHLMNKRSYIRAMESFINKKNNVGNHYVVDVINDSLFFADLLKCLLSRFAMGSITLLSYIPTPNIQAYIESTRTIHNSDFRTKFLNGKKYEADAVIPEGKNKNLLDYFSYISLNDFAEFADGTSSSQKFFVTFEDGTSDNISGDVIFDNEIRSLAELYNNKAIIPPTEIVYYCTPSSFDHLIEIYRNFPKGQGFREYSKLWKTILKQYCDREYKGDVTAMHRADFSFLSKTMMRDYINPASACGFPHGFNRLIKKMRKLQLVTDEQIRYLLASWTVSKQRQAVGKELKEALLEYKCNNRKKEIIQALLVNSKARGLEFSLDDLLDQCLQKKTIIDIIKQ